MWPPQKAALFLVRKLYRKGDGHQRTPLKPRIRGFSVLGSGVPPNGGAYRRYHV
jgi:hypothetical protein